MEKKKKKNRYFKKGYNPGRYEQKSQRGLMKEGGKGRGGSGGKGREDRWWSGGKHLSKDEYTPKSVFFQKKNCIFTVPGVSG
jgi:hypothetical protein